MTRFAHLKIFALELATRKSECRRPEVIEWIVGPLRTDEEIFGEQTQSALALQYVDERVPAACLVRLAMAPGPVQITLTVNVSPLTVTG